MAGISDILRRNRGDSMAPRPAIAQATAPPGVANQEFNGRVKLDGGAKIKLDRIMPDPTQPRKTFEAEPLARLAESMRIRGQLVPGLVRYSKEDEKYIIIDGERRYRAAQEAGLADFRCVVEDESDPDTILEYQLVTNALREGVLPVEQARAYRRLIDARGYTLRQLAEVLGIDFTSVHKALALLDLKPEVQAQVDAGEIAPSTAEKIARLEPEEQGPLADRVVAEGLSRAEVVEAVREVEARTSRKPRTGSPASQGKAKGASKPKLATVRTWKRPGGLKIEASRARGLDLADLAEALRSALAEVEGEIAAA